MPPQHLNITFEEGVERDDLYQSHHEEEVKEQPTHFASTAALCFCMLTHSYLLISVFPYSGFMAIHFIESVNEENAGSYAGLIASAFMIGRATTSYAWGKVADTYGRTAVLNLSLGLSCIFSILFGLSPTFVTAVLVRFCLGASNGIMGSIKTTVSEMASTSEQVETRTMSMVIGMWGYGFLVSPALSGALAEPARQYPDAHWVQEGVLARILQRHPFLLPNLLGATFCILAMTITTLFVRETLPLDRRRDPRRIPVDILHACRRLIPCINRRSYQSLPVLKEHHSDVEFAPDINDEKDLKESTTKPSETTMMALLSRKKTRTYLALHWAFSFVGLTVDETFPLFNLSKTAGFGLSEVQIGKIMSVCGLIFIALQHKSTSALYDRFGLTGSIRFGCTMAAPIIFLFPLSLLINHGKESGELRKATFFYLAGLMANYRIFALVFFSNISVAMNRTVPTTQRATMNGLSVLGGSVAKSLGPIFAGVLVSTSVSLLGRAGSLMIFGTIGLLGCGVSLSSFLFLDEQDAEGGNTEVNHCSDTVIEQDDEDVAATIELIDRDSKH